MYRRWNPARHRGSILLVKCWIAMDALADSIFNGPGLLALLLENVLRSHKASISVMTVSSYYSWLYRHAKDNVQSTVGVSGASK